MWKRESYEIATPTGTQTVEGVTCDGLGMHFLRKQAHMLQPPPVVAIVHLGSGHCVCNIEGSLDQAAVVAADLLKCGDWGFDGFEGYKNRSPELREKMIAVLERHAAVVRSSIPAADAKQARHIAAARW